MNYKINKFKNTFTITLALIFTALLLFYSFQTNSKERDVFNNNEESSPQNYNIVIPLIPDRLDFCGEPVPLYNFEVYERLEREFVVNTYWHSLTILTIQRANRWFPVIEPILKENNIPDDFKYLCVTESTLMNLTSPANAVGFWQFVKSAGTEYGLEINKEIDERYHVEKATEAACKYLKDAYNKYGNWTMAAASYNFGMNGINEQLERQGTNNYYNLVLGEETSRYVFRILATKIMLNNPKDYGFYLDAAQLHKPFETYEISVDSSIASWADFAKSYGINYKILKLYNPWLRESYLTNKQKKEYKIKLPVDGTIEVIPELN
jgi:hypothetical protein